ncbi:MAG: ROK family transcriptional regulator [Caldilineaceae bacterium]
MHTGTGKATHAQTRRHNNRLVLKMVYDQGPISRAEIARSTNLTATTVSTVISKLIADGLVEEIGSLATERGKPPTLVSLVKDARHVIALDLSRHEFQGAILNLRGEIQQRQSLPVAGSTGDEAVTLVLTLIESLLPHAHSPLLGIGIGAPGIIDLNHNLIRRAANLGWENLALGEKLTEHFGLQAQIVNDNQAVLLAEFLFGNYKHTADMVVVRIGNGIGAGVLANGQLLHGNGTGAGEIGHVVVVKDGEPCRCGGHGCLETVASSRAIVKQAQAIARQNHTSSLHALAPAPEAITIQTVIQAFQAGDPEIQALVAKVAYYLGLMIAHLLAVVGMPRVLLCGSVTGFGEPLLAAIRHEVAQLTLVGRINEPHIAMASLATDLSNQIMMGAAATLLAHELGLFL